MEKEQLCFAACSVTGGDTDRDGKTEPRDAEQPRAVWKRRKGKVLGWFRHWPRKDQGISQGRCNEPELQQLKANYKYFKIISLGSSSAQCYAPQSETGETEIILIILSDS